MTPIALIARLLGASLGGYGLAHLVPLALLAGLPLSRVDAVVTAALSGFVVHGVAVLWCFGARSALRAWAGLALVAAPAALLLAGFGAGR